ncbi:type 4a pilus biogenesis protein PilO [Uliginosibacterium sp. H3]|uniref:Type 4a pilus biogenesis protein PilO n=1 Tax=Uliginosibacterium silvisoli TaxID=3114758 RepID=A0ABU6JYR9_9RHOO|nr:type 4a pilus biogenesis protein PilO [Uliginosibacterium sp. H3]
MNAPKAFQSMRGLNFEQIVNDFRQIDPNDPGVWPVAPRVVVLAVVFIVTIGCAWWFDWSTQLETLDQRKEEEVKLKDEWLGKKRQAVNLDEYKRQLADIDRQFGALLKQLPNRSEMEALLVDVNQAGRGRGLQFELWKPGTESVREFYAELPIALRVTGTYSDLGNFAADVAKLPRIVTLRDIVVESAGANGLKMDASAVTYRYLDDEEVAKQKREKSAAVKK